MNFRKLTILTLVFLISGLVGFLYPDVSLANKTFSYSRQKLLRDSREAAKRRLRVEKIRQKQFGEKAQSAKIRFRGLTGKTSKGTTSVSNISYYIIWNGWGLGQSTLKYKTSDNEKTFNITNSFNDVSYTIGDEITFTLGTGLAGKGKGELSTSNKVYFSEKFSGNANFGIIGLEIYNIEFLLGIRRLEFENKEFKRLNSGNTETVESNFKVKGSISLYGLGLGFKF